MGSLPKDSPNEEVTYVSPPQTIDGMCGFKTVGFDTCHVRDEEMYDPRETGAEMPIGVYVADIIKRTKVFALNIQ